MRGAGTGAGTETGEGGMLVRMGLRLLLAAVAAVIALGGCAYDQTGIDALLKPPKLSDEQSRIYTALEASLGASAKGGIKLVYPRKGSYTSAFVKNNLDGESTAETVVFYEVANSATATIPIRINVLDQQQNGEWISVSDVATVAGASEVEKVSFVSIQQQVYMVAGFNLATTAEKAVVIYCFEEGMLKEKYSAKCANFEVLDLNGDRNPELLLITSQQDESLPNNRLVTAELRRITSHGSALLLSSVLLDPTVTAYRNLVGGKLADGRPALYLDGLRGANYYVTEVLACRGNRLENLMYQGPEGENLVEQTLRAGGVQPMDLNGDGVVEIPVRVLAPGYEDSEMHQQEYLTLWYVYREHAGRGELSLSSTSYAAGTLNYLFILPKSWVDRVSMEYISTDRELVLYEFTPEAGRGQDVLAIRAVDNADYQREAAEKGYSLLKDYGQMMYAYKLGPGAAALGATPDLVQANFILQKLQ